MNDKPVVDQAALVRLQGLGGDKLVSQMVRLYLENAAERLQQIDEGLAPGGSVERAEAGAHSLKSSAANVGAMRVNALCGTMETTANRGDLDALRELRGALAEALAEAEQRLIELTEGLDG